MFKILTYPTTWVILPLAFFILGVSFRLLDNSAVLFLKKEILIDSSNVSRELILKEIKGNPDAIFRKKLKRALLYRNFQMGFIITAGLSLFGSLYFIALV